MSIQKLHGKIIFLYLFFPLLGLAGCALPKTTQTQTKQKPGLYNSTGWNNNTSGGIDIEGKVGYRLEVTGPRATCVSPSNQWSASIRIISGQLPPGMEFEGFDIKGIPTKRGNYIVVLELYNLKCNDSYYMNLKNELRFHIGGVGIVND